MEAEAEKFIQLLKNNDEQGIFKMTYHSSSAPNITNDEFRRNEVKKGSDLINQHSLPPKASWIFVHDANNMFDRYSVTVPIFAFNDTTRLIGEIYLAYPPEQISKNIYKFEVRKKGNFDDKPIIAPPPVNTAK
jgi:hypothetical protein